MNMHEFWLAYLFGLRGLFIASFVISIVVSLGCAFAWNLASDDGDKEAAAAWKKRFFRSVPVVLVFSLLSCVPSAQELWEFRVAMLKLEVASPENVAKAGGHIEEVVKALECKHLGVNCPEPEKTK